MRRLILLISVAMAALPAGAAKRTTVAQLEQAVTAATAAHKPASELVKLIAGMELSERLSEATAERLNAQWNAGPGVALALALQADRSAFLDLPVSELPATPAPDQAAQLKMLNAAGRYVEQTLARLPNFLATRETAHYDDRPQEVTKGAWPVRAGLHFVGRSSRETSVLGERTSLSSGNAPGGEGELHGLTSWGEFGSVLGMILADSENGKVIWSHWEDTSAGRAAVFHYSVPKSASHFQVVSSIRRQADLEGFASRTPGSRASSIGVRPNGDPAQVSVEHASRAYQGSLWLDPATGTILRIAIEANSQGSSAFQTAEMLVEYGAVEIGGSSFICPVRSLALSRTLLSAEASTGPEASEWLNETLFTNYHRFVGTTRILTGADAPPPPPEKPADSTSKPQ